MTGPADTWAAIGVSASSRSQYAFITKTDIADQRKAVIRYGLFKSPEKIVRSSQKQSAVLLRIAFIPANGRMRILAGNAVKPLNKRFCPGRKASRNTAETPVREDRLFPAAGRSLSSRPFAHRAYHSGRRCIQGIRLSFWRRGTLFPRDAASCAPRIKAPANCSVLPFFRQLPTMTRICFMTQFSFLQTNRTKWFCPSSPLRKTPLIV